ncbi:TetR/AcrR family transcriptional regulator [Nisaea acidiphila]|uniref:TetR/AcrR family transcriptional regulator n=1 Tax=Nisaea acidiphila TaxID=1862145 RepID=A0A9J7AUJ6_9PROT|nr:TetR/AcrR family transcriptional regulator [Nisaea acidiphila]UUX50790.1 TetR/AcrR family transcriptional regulator [Nisaea acidiphila]
MRKGEATRERLMDIAETAILAKGFAATSIEEIIAEAQITKSGFFYHFKDKNELARALLKRYVAREDALFDKLFAKAADLHDDPLHIFLISLKLLADMMADLPNAHPGCLIASYCYHERLFDAEVKELNRQAVLKWRHRFAEAFETISKHYPPRDAVSTDALADMVSNTVEGAIIMSKALNEPKVLAEQILLLRSYVKLLFQPLPA